MKNRFVELLMILLTAPLFIMCTENTPDLSEVAILITPSANKEITVSSGDKVQYELEVSTINNYVSSLQVSSFDRQYGDLNCLDYKSDKKSFNYTFTYTAPETDRESLQITLNFRATDNLGNEAVTTRSLTVKNKMVSITEKTGIVLYSPFSGLPDAISLGNVAHPFCLADSPQPEQADIYLDCNDNFSSVSWRSNTQTAFLRNNSFNYVEATASSISAVYLNSVHVDVLTDIQPNDIIIVGHGNRAAGVFRVTNILRGIAGIADCMQLSYKGIELDDDTPAENATPPINTSE